MKPLEGLRVMVTRPRPQADAMVSRLEDLGAEVMRLPALEIRALRDFSELDRALRGLATYDWVVLTSVNGVEALARRMDETGIARQELSACKVAVIGPATAAALAKEFCEPDLMPNEFVAEAILDALDDVEGKRFLLARADLARRELAVGLRERGAVVDEVAAYHIVRSEIVGEVDDAALDVVVVTSSEGARATVEAIRAVHPEWLESARFACIGPVTAATLKELGIEPAIVAEEYTSDGLIKAILRDVKAQPTQATTEAGIV